MSRITYVGGFAGGKKSGEKVGKALESYFEDVDIFTLSDYVKDPGKVLKAAKGVTLLTHSAGALSLAEAESQSAYLLNPPLPRHIGGLIVRSLAKTGVMYTPGLGIQNRQDLRAAKEYSKDSGAELLTHPIANLSQLPNIARYDAIDSAIVARNQGTPVNITWTNHDLYFKPTKADMAQASMGEIPVTILEGQHDEVVLNPEAFLSQVFNS